MIVEKYYQGKRYTLSNENLKVGDKVYPIANGRCLDNGTWVLHDIDYDFASSGFPDKPHTILDLKHSDYKPYEVRTDVGFSPIERYYRIDKIEIEVGCVNLINNCLISTGTYKWIECKLKP